MRIARIVSMVLIAVLFAANGRSQTGPLSFEFSFSNPGARSMGFGGAFAALADDATAAFANPAGLVQLVKPEVSVEGRSWGYSTPFTAGGRLSGEPTGILLDTTAGLRTEVSSADLAGLSFLSFVYPRGNWSIAIYGHQLAKFKSSFGTQGFFSDIGDSPRWIDVRTETDLEVMAYGFSGGYRPMESFSIGLGVSYFDADFVSGTEIFAPIEETLPEGPFGPNIYSPEARTRVSFATMNSNSWSWNGGFLWHVSNQFNLGGFYRRGPKFTAVGGERSGLAFEPPVPEGTFFEQMETSIRLPDVFGFGVAFKSANGAMTASFEWDHVTYSTLIDSPDPGVVDDDVELDDANEIHLGFEYVFVAVNPVVAVRAGTWLDPDHRIRFEGNDLLSRALFRSQEDQWHFAFGFGLAFSHFQIDLGVDLSKLVDTASLSAIVNF